jgi:hypothetical protein
VGKIYAVALRKMNFCIVDWKNQRAAIDGGGGLENVGICKTDDDKSW